MNDATSASIRLEPADLFGAFIRRRGRRDGRISGPGAPVAGDSGLAGIGPAQSFAAFALVLACAPLLLAALLCAALLALVGGMGAGGQNG